MRWIKHLTVAHDDPAIAFVLESMGPEGYGIYWLLLEHVGLSIEKDSDAIPTRSHSVVRWSQICHCSARNFRKFCQTAAELMLIECNSIADVVQFGSRSKADRLQIDIPKLLKYRDEYSKKAGQTPVQDRDRDRDREQKETKAPESAAIAAESVKAQAPKINEAGEWFEVEFWPAYPRKVSKHSALRAALTHGKTKAARKEIMDGLNAQLPSLRTKDPQYIPHPATWLNQQRWKDSAQEMFNASCYEYPPAPVYEKRPGDGPIE